MNPAKKYLCLFTSPKLQSESCFREGKGWQEATDEGRIEFVPHVLAGALSLLIASGLFSVSTFLARATDLTDGRLETVREAVRGFRRPECSVEVVAAERPIDFVAWLSAHAPDLMEVYRQDGEVRYGYPSWWRDRAEMHLSGRISEAPARETDPEFDPAALRAFVARRRGH